MRAHFNQMKPFALMAASSAALALAFTAKPSSAAPKIIRDKYDDTIRASVKLSSCELTGSFAKKFDGLIYLDSCYFVALSSGGTKRAWLEFITSNYTWIEMSKSINTAGVFISTPAGTQRVTQPAGWNGEVISGSVLESVAIRIIPMSRAWNLLKSASKVEAKFNKIEYQATFSQEDRQDIKAAMRSIF